ncbi:MAG: trehalose-phosphatase [Oricola sp.]
MIDAGYLCAAGCGVKVLSPLPRELCPRSSVGIVFPSPEAPMMLPQPITPTTEDPRALDSLDPEHTAVFLDFDGVLADIVDDPSDVTIRRDVIDNLAVIGEAAGGAIAVISGRGIAQLTGFLSPLRMALSGAHGAECRSADGRLWGEPQDPSLLDAIRSSLHDFARRHEGLMIETKPFSVALHYRRNPDMGDTCLTLAEWIAETDERISLVCGKMVVELKTTVRTKADAIDDFMGKMPFAGRMPVFFGDDVTDEDGFEAVNRRGGISVKIGEGETIASVRLRDTAAFRGWLNRTALSWQNSGARDRRQAR